MLPSGPRVDVLAGRHDHWHTDVCVVVQPLRKLVALKPNTAVAVGVPICKLATVVDSLTTTELHEERHIDAVQRADRVVLLVANPESTLAGEPRA